MREGAVPTTLILGIEVYITLVDHLCTSFWMLDVFYGGSQRTPRTV
jgi:hypothetical protein